MQVLTRTGLMELHWRSVIYDCDNNRILKLLCDPIEEGDITYIKVLDLESQGTLLIPCPVTPGKGHPRFKVIK